MPSTKRVNAMKINPDPNPDNISPGLSTLRRSTRMRTLSTKAKAIAAFSRDVDTPSRTTSVTQSKKRARTEDELDTPDYRKKAKLDDTPPEGKRKKQVTTIEHSTVPVDPCSSLTDTHRVYTNEEGIWDAMLGRTDVGKNANRFYVIQLLHPIEDDSSCILYHRWGRVGENGQTQKKGPFPSSEAISAFRKHFKTKTGSDWTNRHVRVHKRRKYTFLARDFGRNKKEASISNDDKGRSLELKKEPKSQLPIAIQNLCTLIFSTRLMNAHLNAMQYDAKKLPLGKLSQSTIKNGFAELSILSEVLDKPMGETAASHGGFEAAVEILTGRYYSLIPHIFPRDIHPTIINNRELLKRELDLVDALGDIEVTSKLISSSIPTDESGAPINVLDAHFRSLQLSSMFPIESSSKEFHGLHQYVIDTSGPNTESTIKILHAYRVERQHETEAWLMAGFDKIPDGDRLLLWHGSRTSNFAGILQQGLRIAPPEAPVTDYMFGKGIYFADVMYKSTKFCHASLSDNTALLLLCEVAAKPFFEQIHENINAEIECRAMKALSTKGLGRTQAVRWQDAGEVLENESLVGCLMPKGPPEDDTESAFHLHHNEYIVYDTAQVRLKYLLMIQTE
ncbi:hypothetical protein QCA50_008583 [Cerrena zonata]|uniref:Poly [ADP-ribose] polymerase n=1 Tax=Cerrena zonata TaxID=2478898 RepID=A0AAW0G4F8_9APHY